MNKIAKPIYAKGEGGGSSQTEMIRQSQSQKSVSELEAGEIRKKFLKRKPSFLIKDFEKIDPGIRMYADPLFHQVCDYLGISKQKLSRNDEKQIETILNWAKANVKKRNSPLALIKRISRSVYQTSGERKHAPVYRYIKLLSKKEDIEEQLKVWGRGR